MALFRLSLFHSSILFHRFSLSLSLSIYIYLSLSSSSYASLGPFTISSIQHVLSVHVRTCLPFVRLVYQLSGSSFAGYAPPRSSSSASSNSSFPVLALSSICLPTSPSAGSSTDHVAGPLSLSVCVQCACVCLRVGTGKRTNIHTYTCVCLHSDISVRLYAYALRDSAKGSLNRGFVRRFDKRTS
ncbi:unnamed protein product [Protopolystoma xenopodis]|uniref:Uncharacterized protein n=1 Tax=Protopolystoma xenopodis TaxID=117903 RepID=A0A448XMB5_9PLAT|nr:unnamed protein product [Protopolystoma xenopodis]